MHRVELKVVFFLVLARRISWFLMHRVELKDLFARFLYPTCPLPFLMHRVELKDGQASEVFKRPSSSRFLMHRVELKGENALLRYIMAHPFLMHRVELKGRISSAILLLYGMVPNAPCGVERCLLNHHLFFFFLFLMHRVELKVAAPP